MKVALVFNHPSRLVDGSLRVEQYVAGLRGLGHRPVVVATEASTSGFDGPVHPAADAAAFADPAFWRTLGAEVALVVTWLRMSDVLAAAGEAGTRVVAIADSDGLLGLRRHPLLHLSRLWVGQPGLRARLRAVRFWLRKLREAVPGPGPDEREALASARLSDALVFGDERARDGFLAFLAACRASDLAGRLAIAPWAIAEAFLRVPVAAGRPRRLVAVARWSAPQKDAPLLAAALGRHLAARPDTEVVLFGEGGEGPFGTLAARFPGVRIAGLAGPDVVATTLAAARSIVFASRWEGHPPHAAFEALATGATVVGTPIPSFESFAGRFGRVAAARTAGALAAALDAEAEAWDRGERDPAATAAHWRTKLEPAAVCGALLATLDADR